MPAPVVDPRTRIKAVVDRVESSLFFVPMLFVVGGAALAQGVIVLDDRLGTGDADLPVGIASTVESARAVVSTIAAATITVAGIAFSISLLVVQQAATQYSPRVVQGIFRDGFNKRIMGVVVGTFTYCLVVLRAVRTTAGGDTPASVPNIAVGLAVLFGIASILAVIAFINHNAHRLDVSEILRVTAAETLDELRREWPLCDDAPSVGADVWDAPRDGFVVRSERWGWLQRFDADALAEIAPPNGAVRLETYTGAFVAAGTPLCSVWPPPDDADGARARAQAAVQLGSTRTTTQDATYGIRQMVDIALRALSPGVNDPTTAQHAMFHVGVVLGEMLRRTPPVTEYAADDGRRLVAPRAPTPEAILRLAFDEVREAAAPHPAVCAYLLEVLHVVDETLAYRGDRSLSATLRRHAERVVQHCRRANPPDDDIDRVTDTFARWFVQPPALHARGG